MAFLLKDYTGFEKLGNGGMGVVYLATQVSLNRKVVIKEMDPRLLADKSHFRQFEYEARCAASLDHDNIIRVYDFGEDRGFFYIAMEYIDGPNLEQVLSWDPFPREIGLMIALQAIKGLQFAHQHDIVHRDFKPANILISRTGTVKVADFGIAYTTSRAIGRSDSPPVYLTPEYMSPEQDIDTGISNSRGDIWSAGILLHRIICGKLPYSGENLARLMNSIVLTQEQPIERCVPWLPKDLVRNITACLIKEPEKRLASLDPIIESLQILISDMGILDIEKEIRKYTADSASTTYDLEQLLVNYHIRKGNENRSAGNMNSSAAHFDAAKRIGLYGPQPDLSEIIPLEVATVPEKTVAAVYEAAQDEGETAYPTAVPFFKSQPVKTAGIVLLIGAVVAAGAFLIVFMFQKYLPNTVAQVPYSYPDYIKTLLDTGRSAAAGPSVSGENTAIREESAPVRHPASARHEAVPGGRPVRAAEARVAGEPAVDKRESGAPGTRQPPAVLKITVQPSTAEIFLDGESRPAAEIAAGISVKPGAHTVVANAEGYASYRNILTVDAQSTQVAVITLKPNEKGSGLLHVYSYPWSEVYVDNAYQGTAPTPRPIAVAEGEHVLRLQRDGYKPYVATVTVSAGEVKRIQVNLEKF